MKKVFLIGDSIRIGYDSVVRRLLDDEAQVFWSQDNARFAEYTLRYIKVWAAEDCDPASIDLVHFNCGLWDIVHYYGDEMLTPVDVYAMYLRRIIKRLHLIFPNAKLVFALTTYVIEEHVCRPDFSRFNSDIEEINEVARKIMEENNIPVDDLYTVSREMPEEWHSPDGTHYMPEGYECLGRAVAEAIRKEL